ncbi:MAG: VWA domain-containing protein [bacterium]|nr:VWA domain-containing protein [bacterium]
MNQAFSFQQWFGNVSGNVGTWFGNWFLAPVLLHFLWLIPIVILLYLLKLRRTRVVISSTLLWLKSLQDLTANAPFQRLRKNLLMFLQILVLLAIIAAVARPFFKAEGAAGRQLCVLIDRSASMQTREGEETRLKRAKDEAYRIIDEMEKGDKIMIVSFAEKSDVLCELTDDRVRLRYAIEGIEPSDSRTKLRDAVLVAHSMNQSLQGDLRVIVISDGNISDLDKIGTRAFDLTFVQVGETRENAGIVAFSMREPEEGQVTERQTFVLVHNDSLEPLDSTITLTFEDEVLAVEQVAVGPGEDGELVFQHPELGEGLLKATLDHEDALDADNEAILALQPTRTIRVLLVADPETPSAYFLQRVLLPDPRVELSTLSPGEYVETGEYDLTIFDSFSPPTVPPGTAAFINCVPPMEGMGVAGTIEHPPVIAVEPEHPMMRFNLNPSNVGIAKALQLVIPNDARTLVSTTGGALVADVSRGGQQLLIVGFDIADSDWPLNLSFPLFFQNLLAWVPQSTLGSETSVPAGRSLTLLPDAEVTTVVITRPDGTTEDVELDPLRPVYYAKTDQVGLYEVSYGADATVYAVNLLDRTESAIVPAESMLIGKSEVQAQRGRVRQNRELWRWFVVAGLAILMLEWIIYSRRAWI